MTETTKRGTAHLTSGRLLAKNTLWNLLGNGMPLIVAVFCIPILIRGLGKDRFGVLTLAWVLIGYAGLFDIGLGRALTQAVAKKLGAGEDREVPRLVWTSLLLMLLLGGFGAIVVAGLSPWLVHRLLRIPEALQTETLRSFYLLAVTVPAVITSAGLRGLLEAHQRFDFVTYLRIPMGVFTFAGPLAVLPFSNNLAAVVGVLVAGRFAGLAASFWFCLRVAPELRRQVAWHGPSAGPLLRFGGWMTVSNVVGPMMLYMDRFVIGALVSAAAVAYYATPYEVVTKLLFIPGALVNVMFPAFSTTFGQDGNRTRRLYGHCVKFLIVILLPAVLPIIVFARTGLTIWLGTDFASHSFRVLQWLAVGVLLNSLAQLPFALVQGVGRPDLTAKLHLIELPGYLLALLLLIHAVGIEGAAVAWTARVGVDAAILFVIARRLVPRGVPIVAGAELEAERELGNTRLAAES